MVEAICKELQLRKSEISDEVETIYFGGGTPSLLSAEELRQIFTVIHDHYKVTERCGNHSGSQPR